MSDSFAVFILTHGRPDRVITYRTLRSHGYTGDIYIIIDNEDKSADEYRKQYGAQVITFDKTAVAQTFDECDNFRIGRQSVVYARNACFDIAASLGIRYFLQLDDDYREWQYRFTSDLKPGYCQPQNLDRLFNIVLDYYKTIPAKTIAFAQGGDMISLLQDTSLKSLYLKRKAMNTFFCSIDRPFKFVGRLNEDVNTYVSLGHRGELIFTIFNVDVLQMRTQSQVGGMTGIYEQVGTYTKSFYPVMLCPSCVRISMMGRIERRIHHSIDWSHTVPVIMSERYRKNKVMHRMGVDVRRG